MQVKKIFLASSEELKDDRLAFERMLGRLNQQWRTRDLSFDLVIWEDFVDAMSPAGLQREYNKAVADCDVFVMLFFRKVGPYTLEEFETAFKEMQDDSRPRIYTYFRNDYVLSGELDDGVRTLLDFKARMKALKHYVTHYRNTEDLQYQFSRQLEKLYGDQGSDRLEVGDKTPPVKAGEVALLLVYRQLYGGDAVDPARMAAAIERANRPVRGTVFQMADEFRREHWHADKRLMERTIPVFEALTRSDPGWHAPWGRLGYTLVDKINPDWARAKDCLDRALELRGDQPEGLYYHFNRARCAVQLDAAFTQGRPAEPAARNAVLDIVKAARRDLDLSWDEVLKSPDAEPLRRWLALNGNPRLR